MFLLLFPLVWPFIAKFIWHHHITWGEMAVQLFIVCFVTWIVWALGRYTNTSDTEIWNGEVLSKHREQDTYLESYSCNCVSVSCGKNCTTRVCQTCYRRHWTVDWFAKTTLGKIQLHYLDRTSKSVWTTPDPPQYLDCKVGDPVAQTHSYQNWYSGPPKKYRADIML